MPSNRNISREKINEIINLYLSGRDSYEVADIFKCSQSFVINTLKRNNIPRRTTHSYTRKYPINENFFEKIDTEGKAYFLGLMFSDGNNFRSNITTNGERHDYQINITLQQEDKYILEAFMNLLAPTINLKDVFPKNKNHKIKSSFRINSKVVSDQLVSLGCVPNKSLILEYPNISNDLQNHFIRGYFDGDGSICFWTKKWKTTTNKNFDWKITSSDKFCIGAETVIKSFVDVNLRMMLSCKKTSENKITTTLYTGGNQQVYRLMSWLYKDATIFLKRKYDRFLILENLIKN
jgi:intein-encoded DNA endonuclease-like protein